MSFKRYKSVFQESKKVNKKLSMRKESILNRFKKVLREEDLNPSDVEEIVDKIEDVITDVIGEHGVDNPVVDELSSTVKSINMQNKMVSDIDMMESKLNNKFRKIKEDSMYDMEDEMDIDDEMDMYDTGYDTEFESDEDEFMYDSDSIMSEAESEEDEEEEEMEEAYDKDEDEEEKEKKESYKRKKKIAEMKRRLKEAESEEDEEEDEEMEEAYDKEDDEDEMKEEAESDEGDNLIDYDNGSDYDYLSSIDSEGNFSSGRGMEADMDDNKE